MVFDLELMLVFLYACYLAIQLAAAAHILFTKHEEPASALLWLLLIVLLPVFGLLFYFIFGINRIKTMSVNVHAIQQEVDQAKEKYLGASVKNYLDCLESFTISSQDTGTELNQTLNKLLPGRTPLGGNHIELLRDGTMAYPKMLEDIRKARHSIRLQSFIIMNDPIGQEVFDALEQKAKEGVDVKVLYDSFGSCKAYFSHFFHRYVHKKIKNLRIRAFSPINIFTPWRIQLRNHRKLLVIDGEIAFIGGINISQDNARFKEVPRRKYIHDLHCRITGPAVSTMQFTFLKDWIYATRKNFLEVAGEYDFPEPKECGNSVIRVVDSGPGQNFGGSQNVFFTAAALAKKSLCIITPYFVPSQSFIKALEITAARGVDVRIIVPDNNNHFFVALASQSLYRTLLSCGVKVYAKQGLFSHVKAMLVDEEWAFMGSSNCDVRSFKLNFELDFCLEKGEFVEVLKKQFAIEQKHSVEITLDSVENKSLSRQLIENICALLTPVL
jgi:cardiolipin synthase